jgi:cytochrome c biogenesis protein CcmG/thiol:disulfide interchange protein DsbE
MLAGRVLFLVPLTAFLILVVYLWAGLQSDPRVIPSALIDQPVPEFELPPLVPGKLGFGNKDLRGQVFIVNIFASWCLPCRVEHPFLMQLAEQNTVPVYGINWKDRPADALAWLTELGNPYARIGKDPNNKVGIDFGVYGVPETYIIDAEGRIRFKQVGPIFPEILAETIIPLIRDLQG